MCVLSRKMAFCIQSPEHKPHVTRHGVSNAQVYREEKRCNGWFISHCPSTGWKSPDFDWSEYLKDCQATAAPDSAFTNLVGCILPESVRVKERFPSNSFFARMDIVAFGTWFSGVISAVVGEPNRRPVPVSR